MREIELESVYRHFKGNYYYVKEIAICSETSEQHVVYQALYGENITYIRRLDMFLEPIDENRKDNITHQNYRFESARSLNLDNDETISACVKKLNNFRRKI